MSEVKKHAGGRPRLTEEQKAERKEEIVQKIEPYLKSGLSVNKALTEAKIHNSEFYKYLAEDEFFGERIQRFKNYISILVNNIFTRLLLDIAEKQNGNPGKNILPQTLSKQDTDFLFWYAKHSILCKGEYCGKPADYASFDPEEEICKLKQMINANNR